MADEVTAATDVPLTCEEAFALFSSGLGSWWPPRVLMVAGRARGGFGRHGEGAEGYAEMMGTQGWPYALERFRAAAA
jgi:hypothetical protein